MSRRPLVALLCAVAVVAAAYGLWVGRTHLQSLFGAGRHASAMPSGAATASAPAPASHAEHTAGVSRVPGTLDKVSVRRVRFG
jgi:hypothetical protein